MNKLFEVEGGILQSFEGFGWTEQEQTWFDFHMNQFIEQFWPIDQQLIEENRIELKGYWPRYKFSRLSLGNAILFDDVLTYKEGYLIWDALEEGIEFGLLDVPPTDLALATTAVFAVDIVATNKNFYADPDQEFSEA